MTTFQIMIIILYLIFSLAVFVKGLQQTITKKNPFGTTFPFFWLGVFAWGDGIIIGPFWFFISLFVLLTNNWNLFLLVISTFWMVRSVGETIYWMNQQFVKKESNYYQKVTGYKFIKSDAILFIYQIFWQCINVISIITTFYFAVNYYRMI